MKLESEYRLPALGVKQTIGYLTALVTAVTFFSSAHANLLIDPTFDSTITSDANAATIEATINADIMTLESKIANPITVTIDFKETNSGLGASLTNSDEILYSTYRSALQNNQYLALSAHDNTAIASLPMQANNPVNGSTEVHVTDPLLRALNESAFITGTGFDSTVELNTSIMNLARTGPNSGDPGKYDLEATAEHEIDEVLGIGGSGSTLYLSGSYKGQAAPTDAVGALDLFRYSAPSVRSFSLNPAAAQPYFSINGGATNLTNFNQDGSDGADFSDWAGTPINPSDQVQDASGDFAWAPNLGTNELTALDVVGYTLSTATPEPGTLGLLGVGLVTFSGYRGRRHKAA